MSKPRKEKVKLSDLVGVMCGWAGCTATAEYVGDLLPEGWRALAVTKYSLLEPAGMLYAEIDMMLCSEHVQTLKKLLKQTG